MDFFTFLLVIFLVFLIACLFAPLGLGGGMLFVPIFHYIAGWPIDSGLLFVSLILTCTVGYGGGLTHRKEGAFSDETIKGIAIFAIFGAILGVFIVFLVGDGIDPIFKLISLVMVGWALVKSWNKMVQDSIDQTEEDYSEELKLDAWELRAGIGLGGLLSSVLAQGSGAIYIPILREYTGLSTRKSVGTSLGIMMIVVPVAVISHGLVMMIWSSNQWDFLVSENVWLVIIGTVLATLGGSIVGSKYAIDNLKPQVTMLAFLGVLGVIWLRYLIDIVVFFFEFLIWIF